MDGTDSREEVTISWSPAGIAEDAANNADASSSLLLKRVQDEMPEHDKKCGFAFSKEHKCNLLFNGNTNGIVLQNYDLNERHQDHVGTQLSSSGKAFGNILISIVGSGVLGLPYTFKRTGWLPSTLVLSFVAVLCYYCMMLLVWSRKRLEKERNRFIDSFSDLAFLLYGTWGRFTVDFLLILSQGAFCVAYLIFIGENLTSVFSAGDTVGAMNPYPTDYIKELSDNDESNSVYVVKKFSMGLAANSNIVTRFFSSKAGYVWVVFFFEIALASIGTLTKLAPFSIFADIVNFGSMAVVLEQDITTMVRSRIANISVSQGLSAFPFAIGVGIYAFEGIALVLPLESSMKERKNFGKVLGVAMLCITLLYISFGLMGYFAFGEDTLDIVTLNLGSGWKPTLVKVGLCLGLFFTFAVMMFPVHQLVEQRLLRGRQSILLRAVIVFMAALCAIGIPHFGDFLSLIGNSVCCAVAFIVPALCHIKANREEISKVALGIDYVIIVLGAVYGVWGTVLAVQNICSSV